MIKTHLPSTGSLLVLALLAALAFTSAGCEREDTAASAGKDVAAAAPTDEYEKGSHNGRLLKSGNVAVEITIFETGVEPQFRVFPYLDGKPLDPEKIKLNMEAARLGGRIDRFEFKPEADYLTSPSTVVEPHSFDVKVAAEYSGEKHTWQYASYEGRTSFSAQAAETAGVKVEPAGLALIEQTIDLSGRVILQPQGRADVRATYPGRLTQISKIVGETVAKGDLLAEVESSESLRSYKILAPISGTITERTGNVGDLAGATPLFVITDTTKVVGEFFVYPRDAERVNAGQSVQVSNLTGDRKIESKIIAMIPIAHAASQTLAAHVALPNSEGFWRPGMAIEGAVVVASKNVPLAVRTRALQRFRDFTVVFARVGETYEVRMLELGERTPEWTEVLGGIDPGEIYVSDNAFLIRADVEKSGASHDH
jgi:cobalt-zinc-cadmium efflux system membrane fusion protein